MAVMMQMRWDGVTPRQYDDTRDVVGWETDVPDGALFHVATFDAGGATIVDVWESEAQFQRFVDERLTPGVAKVGIRGEPNVRFMPVHRFFDGIHAFARS